MTPFDTDPFAPRIPQPYQQVPPRPSAWEQAESAAMLLGALAGGVTGLVALQAAMGWFASQ